MARKNDNLQLWLEHLEMTVEEVAEKYRAWYAASVSELGRTAAREMLAEALYTSEGSVQRYASQNRLPAGEFLALLCHRIDKAQAFELEMDNPCLDDAILTLLQARLAKEVSRDADRVREDRQSLDAQRRELDKRGRQFDERDQELDARTEHLDWRSKLVDRRERTVTSRERKVEEREKSVEDEKAWLRHLGKPTTELEVIAAAMKPKGQLAPSAKSMLLAKLEIDEQLALKPYSRLSTSETARRRVQRKEKEQVLAFLTAPVRLLVDWLMP